MIRPSGLELGRVCEFLVDGFIPVQMEQERSVRFGGDLDRAT